MQRAGLRLLSGAVIPIQTEARRYLALRTALMRMWAIVLIQTFARRWLTYPAFQPKNHAALVLQRVFRGDCDRDRILLEHCCAIEIQRRVRGLLATLDVYDFIYKITILQSVIRGRQAISYATDRMVFIIKSQSLVRRYWCVDACFGSIMLQLSFKRRGEVPPIISGIS
jgi:hypothetical protein